MLTLASTTLSGASVGIVLAAAAGVIGAVIALLKLKPEANESAVVQAKGAMETMVTLQEQLEKALERANTRADRYRDERDELERRLGDLQERYDAAENLLGPFPKP